MGFQLKARSRWTVTLDGIEHRVEIEWDRFASGGGRILVDGQQVQR